VTKFCTARRDGGLRPAPVRMVWRQEAPAKVWRSGLAHGPDRPLSPQSLFGRPSCPRHRDRVRRNRADAPRGVVETAPGCAYGRRWLRWAAGIDRMQRELGDEQSKLDALRSQHAASQQAHATVTMERQALLLAHQIAEDKAAEAH
jgi:hypothetical protein